MSLGNGSVANQLPTGRLSLAWRLATGPLKGSGCQARRRPPTWQRAGCQAGAKRAWTSRLGDPDGGSNSTGRGVFEMTLDCGGAFPTSLDVTAHGRGEPQRQFNRLVAFEMQWDADRLPVRIVTLHGRDAGRQSVDGRPEAYGDLCENVWQPSDIVHCDANPHVCGARALAGDPGVENSHRHVGFSTLALFFDLLPVQPHTFFGGIGDPLGFCDGLFCDRPRVASVSLCPVHCGARDDRAGDRTRSREKGDDEPSDSDPGACVHRKDDTARGAHDDRIVSEPMPADVPEQRARRDHRDACAGHEQAVHGPRVRDDE